MDTRLKDIVSKQNRNMLKSFIGAQLFNVIVACLVAWLMFGVVKPALWPSKSVAKSTTEVVVPPTADTAQETDTMQEPDAE